VGHQPKLVPWAAPSSIVYYCENIQFNICIWCVWYRWNGKENDRGEK